MCRDQTAESTFAALPVPDGGDYTLTVFLGIDRQDDRRGDDGHWSPDQMPPFAGDYCIEAGRRHGAWRLRVSRWSGDHGDDNLGPPVVDLCEQTAGPDPLSLLQMVLTGHAPRVVGSDTSQESEGDQP